MNNFADSSSFPMRPIATVVAALIVGFAVAGFGLAAFDVFHAGDTLKLLTNRAVWAVFPIGASLALAVVAYIIAGTGPGLLRLAVVTSPLLVGWVRIVTFTPLRGRDVLYDWLLWGHVLVLAFAVCAALAVEDPWVRATIRRIRQRLFPPGPAAAPPAALGIPLFHVIALGALGLVVTGVLAFLGIVRFLHFNAGTLDLGMYDQIHWSMIHHRWFYTTLFEHPWSAELSRFDYNYNAEHFMPIILLTTAIYWFHQSPVTLLLIQATFVGAAAFPLYFFTLRATQRPTIALIVAASWLLHPLIHQAVLNDYHPDTLVGLFLFLALWAYQAKRPILYALALVGTMACKEDMALLTLAMGLFLLTTHPRRWTWGLATVIAGGVWFWGIATPIMQAAVADADNVYYIRHLDRFRPLIPEGAEPPRSLGGLAIMALTNPGLVFQRLMEMPRLSGLVKLLIPLGLICLVRPQSLLLIAPAIGAHLFSAWSMQARFEIYHAAAVLPWVYVTTVYAIEWLIRPRAACSWAPIAAVQSRVTQHSVATLLAMTAGLSFMGFSAFPLCGQWDHLRFARSGMHEATRELVSRVPADARIAMTSALGPHLAQRPHIYHLPDLPPDTEYVIIDVNVGTFPLQRQPLQDIAWDWIEAEGQPDTPWELVWMHDEQHHYIFKRPDGFTPDPSANRRMRIRWD